MKLRVLVTGAGGFIGSHVVDELLARSHQVIALCKYNSGGTYGWLEDERYIQNSSVELVLGDITDSGYMEELVQNTDVVINMAALIGIPYSYVAPRSYLNVNTMGVLNILEGIRRSGSKLVQISTSEVYGTPESVPITLDHPINPQSPYAASKSAADSLCKSYSNSFDTKTIIVRPFNTFGPRQSMRAVIPTILSQIASGRRIIRLGSTDVKRDFTFVTDTAKGIVNASETVYTDGRVIQLGTGVSYSILEIIEFCREEFGVEIEIETDQDRVRPINSEVQILESDPSVAEDLLGWNHEIDIKVGLRQTYQWISEQKQNTSKTMKYHV
jgi:nucleoside-diphosphate-sugar epimerase